jgi:MFS-type transporter involved in bile tolerance (Atg22 family)
MDTLEIGELINFIVDILIAPALIIVLKKKLVPNSALLITACSCLILSHVLTLLENFFMPGLFDTLEHVSFFGAALFFAVFIGTVSKEQSLPKKGEKA